MGKNKTIPGGERTIILQVLHYFEEEKRKGSFIIPVEQALKRTCAATGVSLSTITRIKREEKKILQTASPSLTPTSSQQASTSSLTTPNTVVKLPTSTSSPKQASTLPLATPNTALKQPTPTSSPQQASTSSLATPNTAVKQPTPTSSPQQASKSSLATPNPAVKLPTPTSSPQQASTLSYSIPRPVVKLPTPGKKHRNPRKKYEIDDSTICSLRNIISSFYTEREEEPTLKKVLAVAKAELNFPGQRETLRNILREKLGYGFKNCKKKRSPRDFYSVSRD